MLIMYYNIHTRFVINLITKINLLKYACKNITFLNSCIPEVVW